VSAVSTLALARLPSPACSGSKTWLAPLSPGQELSLKSRHYDEAFGWARLNAGPSGSQGGFSVGTAQQRLELALKSPQRGSLPRQTGVPRGCFGSLLNPGGRGSALQLSLS
jgi:hypothetical protein